MIVDFQSLIIDSINHIIVIISDSVKVVFRVLKDIFKSVFDKQIHLRDSTIEVHPAFSDYKGKPWRPKVSILLKGEGLAGYTDDILKETTYDAEQGFYSASIAVEPYTTYRIQMCIEASDQQPQSVDIKWYNGYSVYLSDFTTGISEGPIVDMGLSVKWYSDDIVSIGENYWGDSYMWGQIDENTSSLIQASNWDNYKWYDNGVLTKYNGKDNLLKVEPYDDIAEERTGVYLRSKRTGNVIVFKHLPVWTSSLYFKDGQVDYKKAFCYGLHEILSMESRNR